MRLLIGREYEVRVEHVDGCPIDGWFRAKYLTAHAREMGWLWEIDDPRFSRLGVEEVNIVAVRPTTPERADAAPVASPAAGEGEG
jgi:hypothetical protein